MTENRQQAFEHFDAYNQRDPNTFIWNGERYPQEYFLALKLWEWVNQLDPDASEALQLAARCQHIGRWESPRSNYPMDRAGYLRWRKELAEHHAAVARNITEKIGYDAETIAEMESIILKKKIKVNPDVQTMENALCLVFLEYQYEDFFPKHRDKIVTILRKSLLKMDDHGHSFALKLHYSDEGLSFIKQALQALNAQDQQQT